MAQYYLREGAVTAANTISNMTAQGATTGVGNITVPPGVSQIVQVIAEFQVNPFTTTSENVFFLRLSGNGIVSGEQDLLLGSHESVLTNSGAAATHTNPIIIPTAIQVTPNGVVVIQAEGGGTGTPTADVVATLVFA